MEEVSAYAYTVYMYSVHAAFIGWLGPALLENLSANGRDFPLEKIWLYLQLSKIAVSLHTCKATFLASSGTWKPSCSRYFVSIMINPNSGAKSAMYCKLGCEAEIKHKNSFTGVKWSTKTDASWTVNVSQIPKSLHFIKQNLTTLGSSQLHVKESKKKFLTKWKLQVGNRMTACLTLRLHSCS